MVAVRVRSSVIHTAAAVICSGVIFVMGSTLDSGDRSKDGKNKHGKRWAAALVILALLLGPAASAAAQDYMENGLNDTNRLWDLAEGIRCLHEPEDGSSLVSVLVGDQVVFRLREPLGGLDTEMRCATVAQRLRTLLTSNSHLVDSIEADFLDGQAVVKADHLLLVTASETSAAANGTSAAVLAWIWANQLRDALGLDVLSEDLIPEPPVIALTEPVPMVASWYGTKFQGRRTASGEPFDAGSLTAAHRTLPFGTMLRVTNPETGSQVIVRVNDRGPWTSGRELDLSMAAASAVGLKSKGVGTVLVEIVSTG